MTASTTTGGAPLVVGLGGTLRSNSSTERALRYCLASVERQGGRHQVVLRRGPRPADVRAARTGTHAQGARVGRVRCAMPTPSSSARPGTTARSPDWSRTRSTTSRIFAKILGSTSTTRRGVASVALTDGRRRSARWGNCVPSGMRCAPGRRRSVSRSTPPTRSGTRRRVVRPRGAEPTRHARHPTAHVRPRRVGNGVIEAERKTVLVDGLSPAISKRGRAIRSCCYTAASSA